MNGPVEVFDAIEHSVANGQGLCAASLSALSLSDAVVQVHPLGFLALIWRIDQYRVVRLHYWKKSFDWHQSDGLDIHDHVFSFISVLLFGRVVNKEYDIVPGAIGAECIYRTEYFAGGSKLVRGSANVSLRLVAEQRYSAPDVYAMKSGILHRTELNSEEAVTLLAVRYISYNRDGARVVGPDMGRQIDFSREVASFKKREELLMQLKLLLTNCGFAIPRD